MCIRDRARWWEWEWRRRQRERRWRRRRSRWRWKQRCRRLWRRRRKRWRTGRRLDTECLLGPRLLPVGGGCCCWVCQPILKPVRSAPYFQPALELRLTGPPGLQVRPVTASYSMRCTFWRPDGVDFLLSLADADQKRFRRLRELEAVAMEHLVEFACRQIVASVGEQVKRSIRGTRAVLDTLRAGSTQLCRKLGSREQTVAICVSVTHEDRNNIGVFRRRHGGAEQPKEDAHHSRGQEGRRAGVGIGERHGERRLSFTPP
eukprot:4696590-Prymnesium_polylepis.1